MQKIISILTFIIFSSCIYIEIHASTQILSMAEIIDIALKNHPATRQKWWHAQRAASALGEAKSGYYPKLGIEAHANQGRSFKYLNGPDVSYTNVGANFILSYLLYDFGERQATVEAAKMALLAANWQTDFTLQKVLLNVLTNAYSVIHAQEVYKAASESLNDAKNIYEATLQLHQAGLRPISDLQLSESSYLQIKIDLIQKKALLDIQLGKLATSMGLSADCFVFPEFIPPQPFQKQQQIDELITLAMLQRTDLLAQNARLAESSAHLKRVKAHYGPKVSLNGTGGIEHYVDDKANDVNYQIGVNFEMPLFNGFETMYQKRAAYANVNIANEELAELQLEIALEVLTFSKSLEAAQEMLPEAEKHLSVATAAYSSFFEKYQSGKESIFDLSTAQRMLANARIAYSDIKTRWLVSLANLAYATGTLSPYMEMDKSCDPKQ